MYKRRINFSSAFLPIIFFVFVFLYADYAYAYDTFIGHAGLTEASAKLYNSSPNSHPLTTEQIQWLKQGAVEEDTPFRWMNHFYDPVHKQGLKGEFLSSKEWANNQAKQARYSKGDHTWDRALFDYHKGLEKDAFIALGHVLHLIEDATVPAHTRDDAHPTGDSFENWIKDHWPIDVSKTNVLKLSDLDAYFDNVANFSNSNFYSEDTIESTKFSKINILKYIQTGDEGNYVEYAIGKMNNIEYKLFKITNRIDWKKDFKNHSNKEIITLNNSSVLSDYSSLLIPKAVSAGAGVINLFFDTYETEPQKKVLLFQTHPLGVTQEILVKAGYGTIDTWNTFKNTASNLYQEVKQNFWQITDMFEAAKISYNIFKVNAAFAATFEHARNQDINQFSLFQRPDQKPTPQDSALNNQANQNKQSSKNSSVAALQSSSRHSASSQPNSASQNTQVQDQDIEMILPLLTSTPKLARPLAGKLPIAQQSLSGGSSSSGFSGGGGTGSSSSASSGNIGSTNTSNSSASNSASNKQSYSTEQFSSANNQSASVENQTTSNASSTVSSSATSTISSSSSSSTSSSATSAFVTSTLLFLDPPTIDTPASTITLASAPASSTTSTPFSSSTLWTTLPSIILSGSKSASSTAIFVNQNATGVILTTSTWSASITLQNGQNTFNVFAQNAQGVASTIISTAIWRDSVAPTSTLITVSTSSQAVLKMDIAWSATDALSGVAYFDIQSASSTLTSSSATLSASSTPLAWRPFLSHTTSTTAVFSGIDGVTYYFRMRAIDNLGNTSAWTSDVFSSTTQTKGLSFVASSITPSLSHSVVINEIAWAGTEATANDEWMELMNTGGTALDLTGFRLTDGNNDIDFTFTTGTIPAYGYWLLARTTSTTVKRMGRQGAQNGGVLFGTADGGIELLLSTGPKMRVGTVYKGDLKDAGETLSLYDAQGMLIDHIDASSDWFAGSKKTSTKPPRSMQRIDPRASGELISNWETNNGTLINGMDALLNPIFGTPLQPNRGYALLSGTIASSTVLTAKNSPYNLYTFTVPSSTTLTIEPGVLIKAYNVSLVVDGGTLNATGDAQNPVVFTSIYDTNYGAPPLDYAPDSYHADYWHGIAARKGGIVSLNHAILTKGGFQYVPGVAEAVLDVGSSATIQLNDILMQDVDKSMLCSGLGSIITMVNSTVRRLTWNGVIVNDCSLVIEQSAISDIYWGTSNNSPTIFGVEAHRSKTRLKGVNFQNIKGTGVWLDQSLDGTLVKDSSVDDSPTGISITGGVQMIDNMLFKNLSFGVKQTGSAVTTFQNMTDQNFINVVTTTTPAGLF